MDKVNPRCAGLDVHKDSVWAAARGDGQSFVERFGTDEPRDLLRLGDWLAGHGVTHRRHGIDRRVLEAGVEPARGPRSR